MTFIKPQRKYCANEENFGEANRFDGKKDKIHTGW